MIDTMHTNRRTEFLGANTHNLLCSMLLSYKYAYTKQMFDMLKMTLSRARSKKCLLETCVFAPF